MMVELADPNVLMTSFRPIEGTPQADILVAARDSNIKQIVAESGVGGGKTRIATFIAAVLALEMPGTSGFLIGPDYQMLTVDRDEFCERIAEIVDETNRQSPSGQAHLRVSDLVRESKLERRYDFLNSSRVRLKSASDPQKFRGFGIDWAVLDEAQLYGHEVATMARRRMRASRIGKLIIVANIEPGNWVEQMRREAAESDDASTACFLWGSAANPMLSRDELAYAEAHLPEDVWRREYLADRTAGIGSAFEHLDELVGGDYEMRAGARVAIGVDFGQKRDFTVIAALELESGVVVELDRFQGVPYAGEGGVYARVRAAWLRYGRPAIYIDTGGPFGQSHADVLLRDYGLSSLAGLSSSAKRRSPPIEDLIAAFARRACRVPSRVRLVGGETRLLPADVFLREARELVAEARSGYVRYTHPDGGHDDTLIAVALAWRARGLRPAYVRMPIAPSTTSTPGAGYRFGLPSAGGGPPSAGSYRFGANSPGGR